jgi:DNA polymerase-3 subunit alpha
MQMTRRGKMAIVVLDDGHAQVEVVVYNELFCQHINLLKEDQLLIAEVTISNAFGGNDELRIIADKLYDLASARSCHAKKLRFVINGSVTSDITTVARLRELFMPYRQDSIAKNKGAESHLYSYCPVTVIYRNQYATCEIELGNTWQVHLDDTLIESLSTYLQPENVEIIY